MKNLDGRKLFGIVLKENNFMEKESYKDFFEEIWNDDEELCLKFNEKFSNYFIEDGKEISYHFYLNFLGNEEVGYVLELNMMPTLDFISTNKLKEIAEDYNIPIRELIEYDVLSNNWTPLLASENIEFDIISDLSWYSEGIIDLIETSTSVIPNINNLIGFYMDKSVNMIGTTNWDLLRDLLFNEDPIKNTFSRFKKGENK